MKRFFLVVLVLAVGVLICSCATMNSLTSVPLPQIVQIVPPDPNLPPEIKAFSGKWGGRWWCPSCRSIYGMDAVLIIEGIMGERATVVYGWGNSPEWRIKEGWKRFKIYFSRNKEGELILSFFSQRTGDKFEFRVKGDKLEGTVGGNTHIIMKRLQ